MEVSRMLDIAIIWTDLYEAPASGKNNSFVIE